MAPSVFLCGIEVQVGSPKDLSLGFRTGAGRGSAGNRDLGILGMDRTIQILFHGVPVEKTGQTVAFRQYLELIHHLVLLKAVVCQILEQCVVGKDKDAKVYDR